ncbi:MAG TPA: gliding motility-associated C-terminal domain-containing protein [Chitinophagaceae bacterium]|nr:gliding motility-associated C-terminal domain-containing protein [Chitinophagaceae bacterium]
MSICLFTYLYTIAQNCEDSIVISTFSGVSYEDIAMTAQKMQDGKVLKLGYTKDYQDERVCIILSDAEGSFLKSKIIDNPSANSYFVFYTLTEAPMRGVIALGVLRKITNGIESDSAIAIVSFNSQLEVNWAKLLNKNFDLTINSEYIPQAIFCDSEGNIFFSVWHEQGGNHIPQDFFFTALDASGNVLWSKALDDQAFFKLAKGAYNINAVTEIGDKIYFLGAYTKFVQPLFNTPGFAGFAFDKLTGNLVNYKAYTIPYLNSSDGYYGDVSTLSYNYPKLFPGAGGFSYAFSENSHITGGYQNLINFRLDTNLNYFSARKFKGRIGSMISTGSRMALSPDHSIAITGYLEGDDYLKTTQFAVVDSSNNILLSKKINSFDIDRNCVSNLDFGNKGKNISVIINDSYDDNFAYQANVPIYENYGLTNCLGKDTTFFTIEPVTLQEDTVHVDTVYSNVVTVSNLTLTSTDTVLPNHQYCIQKSSCNFLRLTGDTSFCTGSEIIYTAKRNDGCFRKIIWNTDSLPVEIISQTDSTVSLRFTSEWKGYLKANLYDCTVADSMYLQVTKPLKEFNLGKDTVLCEGDSITLKAPEGYTNYLWSTGDTVSNLNVYTPGAYFLSVSDYCGNVFTDTIEIKKDNLVFPFIADVQLCSKDSFFLKQAPYFYDYKWMPSDNVGLVTPDLFFINPGNTATYKIQAIDSNGCKQERNFTIIVQKCPQNIWFPTAFTPNYDGKNDYFGPVVLGRLRKFSFKVYDRWGEIVFSSDDPLHQWDGRLKGNSLPGGVYIWVCNYQFEDNLSYSRKGTVMLIR